MKKIILTGALLLSSLTASAQWGVVTLERGVDYVPMEMWYTIHEKDRTNQMYFTSHDAEVAGEVLQKVLADMDIMMEDTLGTDSDGDPYWGIDLGNGFYSYVYFSHEETFYTVTILADEQ
jgi:hypothetical protein